jgi:broad specificity phosphatase PhoE
MSSASMILLVRHGETPFNAARVVQPADTPLSERGLAQAACVARRVTELGAGLVLASDLERARKTAQIIADAVAAPLELSELLQERNFGELRGKPYSELAPDAFSPLYAPPGGESGADVDARAIRAFALILKTLERVHGNLVVVSHGLFCAALVRAHVLLPDGLLMPDHFANCSLTTVERIAPYRVQLLNDVSHLAELHVGAGIV